MYILKITLAAGNYELKPNTVLSPGQNTRDRAYYTDDDDDGTTTNIHT